MEINVDGKKLKVFEGSTVAAAIMSAGLNTRISISGKKRAPLCGMGICHECRAEVDGNLHERTCMILCREGMEVKTK